MTKTTGARVNATRSEVQTGPRAKTQDTRSGTKDGRTVPARAPATFRAFWPITDQTVPPIDLIREAAHDLPMLTARAHAVLVGQGSWSITPSCKVPGSGRISETVLLYEAPATQGRSPFDDSWNEATA